MHYANHVTDYTVGAYRNKSEGRMHPDGYRVVANQRLYTGRPPYKAIKQQATVKVFPVREYTDLDRAHKQAVLYAILMNRRRLGSRDPKGAVWNPEREGKRWCGDYHRSGLRVVGFADEIVDLRHKGWFTDEFQDETYRGIVFQLPARNGKEQYLAGYIESGDPDAALAAVAGQDHGRIDMDIFDDKIGAAHAADSMAEHDAEEAREYQEAWQMGQRAEEHETEANMARTELLELLAQVRTEGKPAGGTAAHALLASKVRELLGDMRRGREDRDKLIEDAPTWDKRLREAFNEGYGKEVL